MSNKMYSISSRGWHLFAWPEYPLNTQYNVSITG
jgi:hypothetical protein